MSCPCLTCILYINIYTVWANGHLTCVTFCKRGHGLTLHLKGLNIGQCMNSALKSMNVYRTPIFSFTEDQHLNMHQSIPKVLYITQRVKIGDS